MILYAFLYTYRIAWSGFEPYPGNVAPDHERPTAVYDHFSRQSFVLYYVTARKVERFQDFEEGAGSSWYWLFSRRGLSVS